MEKEQRLLCFFPFRPPRPVEQLGPVPTGHRLLSGLHGFLPIPARHVATPLRSHRSRSSLRHALHSSALFLRSGALSPAVATAAPWAMLETCPAHSRAGRSHRVPPAAPRYPI